MERMEPLPLYKNLGGYITVLSGFWLMAGIAIWAMGYEGSFLELNRLHTPAGDMIMPHLTHLGEAVICCSLFSFWGISRNPALIITMILTMATLALVIFLLKTQVFGDWMRPYPTFSNQGVGFHHIPLRQVARFSFPSGHSAAAAAMYAFFAVGVSQVRPGWTWAWGMVAVVVAYTRLYIGVHFLGDIIAGSMIGFCLAYVGLVFVYPFFDSRIKRMASANQKKLKPGLYIFAGIGLAAGLFGLIRTYYLPGS